jgi:hypothetical protein
VQTSNKETDIARIVAPRSIVDDEDEGESAIPEAYSQDVLNSVKSYRGSSKQEECTARLQHLWMVKFEHEKQPASQNKVRLIIF